MIKMILGILTGLLVPLAIQLRNESLAKKKEILNHGVATNSSLPTEKTNAKLDFLKKVHSELNPYVILVQTERSENEYMMADDNLELATQGLETIIKTVPQLYEFKYVKEFNKELSERLSAIENQAKSDLEYLQTDWIDDCDDAGEDIIDVILNIHSDVEKILNLERNESPSK